MKIYNSLTRKKEEFNPPKTKEIKMYVCGPTVYDEPHIGHARAAYIFDFIRNYFEYKGYKVKFTKNITDVDDKIIAKAKEELPDWEINEAVAKIAQKYTQKYYEDMDALGIRRATHAPCATEFIDQMQKYIARLIKKDFAYEVEGDVYFDVRKFKEYGALSNQNIDQMRSTARIEKDEKKKDVLDFALWKKAKEGEPFWESPWGNGRPGWHIECSVMSSTYLGDEFDIHGGGRDLIFPHHENEIAQSHCFSGKSFAKIWIHNGLLTINGQKMAKSLGNFITVRDFLRRYNSNVVKLFFLQTHYSQPIDFTWERMEEKRKALETITSLFERIKQREKGGQYASSPDIKNISPKDVREMIDNACKDFEKSMEGDFNTSNAIAVLFEIRDISNKVLYSQKFNKKHLPALKYAEETIKKLADVFDISFKTEMELTEEKKEKIEGLIQKREALKKKKMFKEADKIREDLGKKGVILEDTKEGTEWRRRI